MKKIHHPDRIRDEKKLLTEELICVFFSHKLRLDFKTKRKETEKEYTLLLESEPWQVLWPSCLGRCADTVINDPMADHHQAQ